MKEGGYLREAIILNNYFLLRGDDYSREAIMLNISFQGRGDFSRVAINRRTAIIRGNSVTDISWYQPSDTLGTRGFSRKWRDAWG